MPWCPNCKAEYQEGYTVCSDCKVDLVDYIYEAEVLIPFFQAEDKKIAEKLVKFFLYSDLNAALEYDEEIGMYIVTVPPKKQMQAKKLYQAFYYVERERLEKGESDLLVKKGSKVDDTDALEQENSEETEGSSSELNNAQSEDDYDELSYESEDYSKEADDYDQVSPDDEGNAFEEEEHKAQGVYVMKEDQYKDLSGTVWIFLFFGVAGLVVVLLNIIDVLHFFSGWIPNVVMSALFLFFLYVAISTNQKAKKVRAEIDTENKLTEQVNEWLKVNVTESFLSSIYNDNLSEELNYLKATDLIKDMLIKEFGNQNLAYLDRLIEEYYNSTFDSDIE